MAEKPPSVTIVDYGMGNLSSVARAFGSLHAKVTVTDQPAEIEQAEKLVLPGVGAFGEGMNNLQRRGLIDPLKRKVRSEGTPFLGICLGMQLLAKESLEHGRHEGLGWVPGTVQPFQNNGAGLKTIHIGWDEVRPVKPNVLFSGLKRVPYFYFVHQYHMVCQDNGPVCATSSYGAPFTSAIQQGNILGVQFHPEKSQEAGLGLLKNFLQWNLSSGSEELTQFPESGSKNPTVRLIPTLLYRKGRLTKTVKFQTLESGIRRDVGDPVKAPMVYDAQLSDELIFLDFRATVENRGVEQLAQAISQVSGSIFMPLTAGGGIRSTDDIRKLLLAGADKVAINSAAFSDRRLIPNTAKIFGSQCIVASIDVRQMPNGGYEVFTQSGTTPTGLDPVTWARQLEQDGAGEILLTSIDRDGTLEGYDLQLIKRVAEAVKIPVIASGGAGKFQDLVEGITQSKASAVAAASIFHFRDLSPIKAKAFMRRSGLPVRD